MIWFPNSLTHETSSWESYNKELHTLEEKKHEVGGMGIYAQVKDSEDNIIGL